MLPFFPLYFVVHVAAVASRLDVAPGMSIVGLIFEHLATLDKNLARNSLHRNRAKPISIYLKLKTLEINLFDNP